MTLKMMRKRTTMKTIMMMTDPMTKLLLTIMIIRRRTTMKTIMMMMIMMMTKIMTKPLMIPKSCCQLQSSQPAKCHQEKHLSAANRL